MWARPAQGAQPAVEAVEPLERLVVAPAEPVATDLLATAQPRAAARPETERRPAPASSPRTRANNRPSTSVPAQAPADAVAKAEVPAPQTAPVAPVPEPLADREPDVVAAVEEPRYEDLVLPAQSVIGIQLERAVSSETAQVEDEVIARVTRDVRVGDRVVIPAGSRATGFVTLVERGGRLKDRARLGFRFGSVTLADGTRVPIVTEAIYREGESPRNESAAKIGGGAIGGAILGGILGGAKGAAIGGSIGAGAGSAAVYAGGRNAATLPAGSPITVRLENPAT